LNLGRRRFPTHKGALRNAGIVVKGEAQADVYDLFVVVEGAQVRQQVGEVLLDVVEAAGDEAGGELVGAALEDREFAVALLLVFPVFPAHDKVPPAVRGAALAHWKGDRSRVGA
jgi:hypothetical protein